SSPRSGRPWRSSPAAARNRAIRPPARGSTPSRPPTRGAPGAVGSTPPVRRPARRDRCFFHRRLRSPAGGGQETGTRAPAMNLLTHPSITRLFTLPRALLLGASLLALGVGLGACDSKSLGQETCK